MGHSHDDHDHDEEHSELGEMDVRVRALETLLTEKGYVDPAALDELIRRAADRTPHGHPVELVAADFP